MFKDDDGTFQMQFHSMHHDWKAAAHQEADSRHSSDAAQERN